jgi:hypothetical protein
MAFDPSTFGGTGTASAPVSSGAVVVKWTDTDLVNNGVKCIAYGPSGIGKTRLCATAPRPLVISAENGLLSLKRQHVPYIEVKSLSDFENALAYGTVGPYASNFDTLCVDSLSDIAEVTLAHELANNKDGRKAYGEMQQRIMEIFRNLRDIPRKHVVMVCKMGKFTDQATGWTIYGPLFPGSNLDQNAPYMVDEVFRVDEYYDQATNTKVPTIHTQRTNTHEGKDRSGALAPIEWGDLSYVFNKIMTATA